MINIIKMKTIIILSINSEYYSNFYEEIYSVNQNNNNNLIILNIDVSTCCLIKLKSELIENHLVITNIYPGYSLGYKNKLVDEKTFTFYKVITLSNYYSLAAIMLDYYHNLKVNNVEPYNYVYNSPEGDLKFTKSNNLERYIRIGIMKSNNIKFNHSSIFPIKPEPYYLRNRNLNYNTCNCYEETLNNSYKTMIIIKSDTNTYRHIYNGYLSALFNLNNTILNYNIVLKQIDISEINIINNYDDSDIIGIFGCDNEECVNKVITAINNRKLFLFSNLMNGICNDHVIHTFAAEDISLKNYLNYYYSHFYKVFILIVSEKGNILKNIFNKYCEMLGISHFVLESPTYTNLKEIIEIYTGHKTLIINSMLNISPEIFNFISTHIVDDSLTFCSYNTHIYINNDEYYTENVCSISTYFEGNTYQHTENFENIYDSLFDDVPNFYSFTTYYLTLLINEIIKEKKNLSLYNIMYNSLGKKYKINNINIYISKQLFLVVNMYHSTIIDGYYDDFIEFSNEIETESSIYYWEEEKYEGYICSIDLEEHTYSITSFEPLKIGLLFNITVNHGMELNRPSVMSILNSIHYLRLQNYYPYKIVTRSCVSREDFKDAVTEFKEDDKFVAIIGGASKFEIDIAGDLLNNTNIYYFYIRQFSNCPNTKNAFSGIIHTDNLYPVLNYFLVNNIIDVGIIYTDSTKHIVDEGRSKFIFDNYYYINVGDHYTFRDRINEFINDYIFKKCKNIVVVLDTAYISYFSSRICSIKDTSTLDVFYIINYRYLTNILADCPNNINNYIPASYNTKITSNIKEGLFQDRILNSIINDFQVDEISSVQFAENQFMSILFVYFIYLGSIFVRY